MILIKDEDENVSPELKEEVEDEDTATSEFSSSDSDDDKDQDFSLFPPVKKKPVPAPTPSSSPSLKEFICDYCQHSFKAKQGLTRHVQSHIDISVPWKCDELNCSFAASSKKKLNLHKFHSHNIPLPMNKNDYVATILQKEVNAPITVKDFNCFCGVSFGSMFSLRAHKNRLHRNKNKCNFGCKNVQYVKTGHFLRHVKAKHPDMLDQLLTKPRNSAPNSSPENNEEHATLQCDKCEFATQKRSLLQCHVESHVPYIDREKFECVTCHKLFTRATSLRVHRQTIHEKIRRMALKHAKDRRKPFKCSMCDRRFLKRYMMNRHQQMAHKVDSAKTPVNALFRNLKAGKKFKCNCGKEFSSKSRLTRHKIKHNENFVDDPIKMFQCPQQGCSNAFTQRCNLIRHQKAKGHLRPEEIVNLKFTCACGDRFFSYRGYSYHCDKNNCKKKKAASF